MSAAEPTPAERFGSSTDASAMTTTTASAATPPHSPSLAAERDTPLAPGSPYLLTSAAGTQATEQSPMLASEPSLTSTLNADPSTGSSSCHPLASLAEGYADTREMVTQSASLLTSCSSPHDIAPAHESNLIVAPRIRTSHSRPRFWALLPLLALLDVASENYVGISVMLAAQSSSAQDYLVGGTAKQSRKPDQKILLCVAILGICLMRSATIAVVGISNKTDQLGLVVAAVCAISALVLVAVFNLLFQSGNLYKHQDSISPLWNVEDVLGHVSKPSLALLTSIGLVFTLLEYVMYVLVVGIRVPPGGGVAISTMQHVRQWKRGIRSAQPRGEEDEHWVIEVEAEDGGCAGPSALGSEHTKTGAGTPERMSSAGSSRIRSSEADLSALDGSRRLSRSAISGSLMGSYGATTQYVDGTGPPSFNSIAPWLRSTSHADSRGSSVQGRRSRQDESHLAIADPDTTSMLDDLHFNRDVERNPDIRDAALLGESSTGIGGERDGHSANDYDDDDDPNEIKDIPFPSSTSRDLSRFRLALSIADEPERRRSRTLSAMSRSPSSAGKKQLRGGSDEEQSEQDVPPYEASLSRAIENSDASAIRRHTASSSTTYREFPSQQPHRQQSVPMAAIASTRNKLVEFKKPGKSRDHPEVFGAAKGSLMDAASKRWDGPERENASRSARATPAAMLASLPTSPMGIRGPPESSAKAEPLGQGPGMGGQRSLAISSVTSSSASTSRQHTSSGPGRSSTAMAAVVRAGDRRLRYPLSLSNNTTSPGLGIMNSGSQTTLRESGVTTSRRLFGGRTQSDSRSQRLID